MKIRSWRIWIAVAYCLLPLSGAWLPGDRVPDLSLRDVSGHAVRLSAFRQKKHVVLLAPAPGATPAGAILEDTSRRLAALGAAVLLPAGETKADRIFLENAGSATVLVDSEGVVRRVLEGRVLTGPDLAEFVRRWQSGKAVFTATCARCHGEDGDLRTCEDVKPLAGIGRRLSEAQILDRLRIGEHKGRDVPIRGYTLSRQEVDEVIAYVAGL